MLKSKGISTIEGKDIWFDNDVQRLNEDGRGTHLGKFSGDDKILAVFRNGTYYTTSYDLSNRYQGELILIEKYDPAKTFATLYFDGASKQFYIKRFTFPESNNSPAFYVPEGKGNYLADFSSDRHPQFMVTFTGRQEHREPEKFDAEEFIAVKGVSAKGNRCHRYDVLKVEFIEPLVKPGDEDVKDEEAQEIVNMTEEVVQDEDNFSPESMYRPAGNQEEEGGETENGDEDNVDEEPNLFDM